MNLSGEQQALLDEAEGWVKRFVEARGEFSMFALAKHIDGKTNPLQPTDEFPDMKSALVETIHVLLALARDGQIMGAVICTPITAGKDTVAMLDLEYKGAGRVLAFLPYKKRLFGGWTFGEKQFKADVAKLFAS